MSGTASPDYGYLLVILWIARTLSASVLVHATPAIPQGPNRVPLPSQAAPQDRTRRSRSHRCNLSQRRPEIQSSEARRTQFTGSPGTRSWSSSEHRRPRVHGCAENILVPRWCGKRNLHHRGSGRCVRRQLLCRPLGDNRGRSVARWAPDNVQRQKPCIIEHVSRCTFRKA